MDVCAPTCARLPFYARSTIIFSLACLWWISQTLSAAHTATDPHALRHALARTHVTIHQPPREHSQSAVSVFEVAAQTPGVAARRCFIVRFSHATLLSALPTASTTHYAQPYIHLTRNLLKFCWIKKFGEKREGEKKKAIERYTTKNDWQQVSLRFLAIYRFWSQNTSSCLAFYNVRVRNFSLDCLKKESAYSSTYSLFALKIGKSYSRKILWVGK